MIRIAFQVFNNTLSSNIPLTKPNLHTRSPKEPHSFKKTKKRTMSSTSLNSSLSSRTSRKNNIRPCPTCPYRLSDIWKHEATSEPEYQPENGLCEGKTNAITGEDPGATAIVDSSGKGEIEQASATKTTSPMEDVSASFSSTGPKLT